MAPGLFRDDWINIFAVDDLAMQCVRSSTPMLLIVYGKRALVFHKYEFELHARLRKWQRMQTKFDVP